MLNLRASSKGWDDEDGYGGEHPRFENPERVAWAGWDESLYVAALLYAGAEPEVEYVEAYHNGDCRYYATSDSIRRHTDWQARAAKVLMTKYERYWWFIPEANRDPDYRRRSRTVYENMQNDELRYFYTWLCKQRGEPWTERITPR